MTYRIVVRKIDGKSLEVPCFTRQAELCNGLPLSRTASEWEAVLGVILEDELPTDYARFDALTLRYAEHQYYPRAGVLGVDLYEGDRFVGATTFHRT